MLSPKIPSLPASPAESRIRVRGAGRSRLLSTRPCPRTSCRQLYTIVSALVARRSLPTSCSRPCATSSAGTSRNRLVSKLPDLGAGGGARHAYQARCGISHSAIDRRLECRLVLAEVQLLRG